MRFDVHNRFDNYLFSIGNDDLLEATWTRDLTGVDTLTLSTDRVLNKDNRIVWRDRRGKWHEHIVDSSLEFAETAESYNCLNSLIELYGVHIEDVRPEGGASVGIAKAIQGTRWQPGIIDVEGSNHATYYHTSAREAIQQCVETWGGELETEIRVAGCHITERLVNLRKQLGEDNGKRFVYTKDLQSAIRNIVSDNVITRLYGYGKGEEVGDGYGRRINFSSVNGGLKYIEDEELTELWGYPDEEGGKKPFEGQVIFEDCEDVNELLARTKEYFEDVKVPKVSYSANVTDLEMAGFAHEGCDLGDTVAIIDEEHNPPIRVKGRVTAITEDLLTGDRTITIGNYIVDSTELLAQQQGSLSSLENRSSMWDVSAYTPAPYLQQVISGLNEQFNLGGSYKYESWTMGTIYASVPLDENGKPTRTPATAMQLTGLGFRIANSVNGNGEFEWRTFGTGEGFTADCITAGVIRGGSNYWNLNTGDLSFSAGSIQDSRGNSWNMTTGTLTFQNGTINASMLTAGTIQDQTGTSSWNLTTGELRMQKGRISDARGNYWDMSSGTLNFVNGTIRANQIEVKNSVGQTILKGDEQTHQASVGGLSASSNELTGSKVAVNTDHFDIKGYGTIGVTYWDGGSLGIAATGGAGVSFSDRGTFLCAFMAPPNYNQIRNGTNFQNNKILNAILESCTIQGASNLTVSDGIDDTMNFIAVTKVNPDGTIAEYVDGCSMEFRNGLLTEMAKPE